MKIAVCLSGHYRTHDTTFLNSYEKLYSKYDCDVFLHTWNINGSRINFKNDEEAIEDLTPLVWTSKQLKQKFNFKAVVIEDYKQLHQKFLNDSKLAREKRNNIQALKNRRAVHLYSMWYKALKCYQMMELYAKQTNTKYDIVIKTRPDLLLFDSNIQTTLQFEHLSPFDLNKINMDTITIPLFNKSTELHDYFAVGTPHLMSQYHNLYNHMKYLLHTITDLEDFLNGHTLLYYYTQFFNIPVTTVRNFITIQR